jgi:hypothetical protein
VAFRFRYEKVTYIDPDSHGWGQPGTVLFGRLESGTLRAGVEVDVPTAGGVWRRVITTLADPDFRKMSQPDGGLLRQITAGDEPVEFMVYFGRQPPGRDIVCPGFLEGDTPTCG